MLERRRTGKLTVTDCCIRVVGGTAAAATFCQICLFLTKHIDEPALYPSVGWSRISFLLYILYSHHHRYRLRLFAGINRIHFIRMRTYNQASSKRRFAPIFQCLRAALYYLASSEVAVYFFCDRYKSFFLWLYFVLSTTAVTPGKQSSIGKVFSRALFYAFGSSKLIRDNDLIPILPQFFHA